MTPTENGMTPREGGMAPANGGMTPTKGGTSLQNGRIVARASGLPSSDDGMPFVLFVVTSGMMLLWTLISRLLWVV